MAGNASTMTLRPSVSGSERGDFLGRGAQLEGFYGNTICPWVTKSGSEPRAPWSDQFRDLGARKLDCESLPPLGLQSQTV